MYVLNLRKCNQLLKDKPIYNVAREQKRIDDDISKFFSIVCKCKTLNQVKDVSINDLLRYITKADDYIDDLNETKGYKINLMIDIFAAKRIEKKRLF